MIFFIILLILCGLALVAISAYFGNMDDAIIGMLGGIVTFIGVIGLINTIKPSPKAIDVYRGKTELKITGTYKDSIFIPTDSTVIFKRM